MKKVRVPRRPYSRPRPGTQKMSSDHAQISDPCTARLRITLCGTHTAADVDELLTALERAAAAQECAA